MGYISEFTENYYEAESGAFNMVLMFRDYYGEFHVVARTDGEYVLPDRGFIDGRDNVAVSEWADEYGFTFEY